MSEPARDVVEKGPGAFRTISEVADDLGLPQHVLRFWETRFPQIKPIKRGGGRRYYRPNDVELLRGVKHLLYGEGYTIRGVQRILREQGGRRVAGFAEGGAPAPDPHDGERFSEAPEAAPAIVFERATPSGLMGAPSGPELWAPQRRTPPSASASEPTLDQDVLSAAFSVETNASVLTAASAPTEIRPAGLSDRQKRRLRDVLADLQACRRLVDERL